MIIQEQRVKTLPKMKPTSTALEVLEEELKFQSYTIRNIKKYIITNACEIYFNYKCLRNDSIQKMVYTYTFDYIGHLKKTYAFVKLVSITY